MPIDTVFIEKTEFDRVQALSLDEQPRLKLLAAMCRVNVLASVKRAGSGHLGTSFSSLDLFTALYWRELNTLKLPNRHADRDIFLSSKGHDAPAIYAVLYAAGVISEGEFLGLRRLGGTPGHPDVNETLGIEANTGSLGMGISKGKGFVYSKRLAGSDGRVFVLTGDGEWQEGQNFEALQSAVAGDVHELTVIIDHNKVQSDRLVNETLPLGDLQAKIASFGWWVYRCDGHSMGDILTAFDQANLVTDKPKCIIADTIKGRGVSFMEHPKAMEDGSLYRFHSGAPDDTTYSSAHQELCDQLDRLCDELGVDRIQRQSRTPHPVQKLPTDTESLTTAYGDALVQLGQRHTNIVVLDADLALDCKLLSFQKEFPKRFIECGIAEQDMVSTASALALGGFLPIVNSFGVFLAARANEQIYNQNTEQTKVVYVCNYAGLLPAGPGHSHQSLRDISLFGSLPSITILAPASSVETQMLLEWAVESATTSVMIRLPIGATPAVQIPSGYAIHMGRGVVLHESTDAEIVIFASGPQLIYQAMEAAKLLKGDDHPCRVVHTPWINRIDGEWLKSIMQSISGVIVLDDHNGSGGFGDNLLNALSEHALISSTTFRKLSPNGIPACGTPEQVLKFHGLDGESIADVVRRMLATAKRA